MNIKIAVIDNFLPGEALQIAEALRKAFDASVDVYYTLADFLPAKPDLRVLVMEYDFPLTDPSLDDPECGDAYERIVAQIPSLNQCDPLYMNGTSVHLINKLREDGCYIPIIIHTHRNGELGEELPNEILKDPMVRIVQKGLDGFTQLHHVIRELLKKQG